MLECTFPVLGIYLTPVIATEIILGPCLPAKFTHIPSTCSILVTSPMQCGGKTSNAFHNKPTPLCCIFIYLSVVIYDHFAYILSTGYIHTFE